MLPCLTPGVWGRPTTEFVEITLSGQADEVLDAFEREVALIPDVLECHLMAGTADYILKVGGGGHRGFRPHPPPSSGPPARGGADAKLLRTQNRVQDDSAAGVASPDNRSHVGARDSAYIRTITTVSGAVMGHLFRAFSLFLLLAGVAQAHDKRFPSMWVDDLLIHAPVLKATPEGAPVAAGYMGIENTGDTDEVLNSAEVEFAHDAQLHEMVMSGDVMKMRQIEGGIQIPAGGNRLAEARRPAPDANETVRGVDRGKEAIRDVGIRERRHREAAVRSCWSGRDPKAERRAASQS